jgi:general secretion pathway protein D
VRGASSPYSPSVPASSPTPSSSPVGQSIVSDFTKFIPDEVTNSIIILTTPEEYVLIKSALSRIDIYPRQVVIEGMVAAVTLTDNLTLGLSGWINGRIGEYNVGGGIGGTNLSTIDFTKPFGTNFTLYAINEAQSIRFLITALATDSKAKLLATPHILVSDNREAKIQVGQSVPLVTSETYGSTTVAPQRTIQYRDIGIILKVKPRVNESGLVALDLYQEVSTYSTIKLYNNEDQIILNNDNAATNVVVQDGQTIIIGGLIREDLSKTRSGIPFLSKIPYIGWLFGNWINDKTRTEIIILLTPRVVKNQKQASDVTKKYIDNMADESQGRITREELMKGRPKGQ